MMYQLEYSYRPTGIKHCILSKIPSSYYRLPQCLKRVGNSYFFREILQQQKRHLPLRRHSIITSDLSIVKATRITLFPRHLIQEESVGSYYIHINHSIAHSKIQGTVMYLAHNGELEPVSFKSKNRVSTKTEPFVSDPPALKCNNHIYVRHCMRSARHFTPSYM